MIHIEREGDESFAEYNARLAKANGWRELGPEMIGEAWMVIGDFITWQHPPSQRVVTVDGPIKRENAHVPTLFDKPCPPDTPGWVVTSRYHDDLGNPISAGSTWFWLESFGEAVKRARAIRQSILDERRTPAIADQLTLDDALAKEPS